jgi:natural product precursor
MKKIGSLKLNQINKTALKKREMNILKGGVCCTCGCVGPSSAWDNGNANVAGGYSSPGGGMGGTA